MVTGQGAGRRGIRRFVEKAGVLLASLSLGGCLTAETRMPGVERERFHISCFSFNAPAQTRAHIREAKECGLDFVGGGIDVKDVALMELFAEEGMDASCFFLPRVCGGGRNSDELRKLYPREWIEGRLDEFNAAYGNPSVRLMNICDEPGAGAMPFLGEVVRLIEEKCPHTRAYVNLFPNYAQAAESDADVKASQLGVSSYKKYIDEYCRFVPTPYICYDHYPVFDTPARTRKESARWYGNLKVVADACRRTKRDLWVGPQANSRPGHPPLSENSLRYQAFSAMAFGAVDLTWACWTLGWWDHCLMETNGTLTCQYPKLRKVNAEVRMLAEHYMKLRNVATHFVGFEDEVPALGSFEIEPVVRLSAGGVLDLASDDGSSLVVGEMVPREGSSRIRGLFIFGADDCGDERKAVHTVRFSTAGAVRAFGPDGAVAVKDGASGAFSLELADNSAVLLLVKR